MSYIVAAYDGRVAMLKAIFGSKEDPDPEARKTKKRKLTKQDFILYAKTHNALLEAGRISTVKPSKGKK